MRGGVEVRRDEPLRFEAHRDVAYLVAFAVHTKMQHPFALLQIAHAQRAEFLAAQPMVEERRQDGAIALAFERRRWRCLEEHAGLLITQGRRQAFVGIEDFGPLHAFDGIVHHGVALAEILEERGDRGELAPDRRAGHCPALEALAPGDEVGARDHAEFLRTLDAGKVHEVLEIVLVGAARLPIRDVGKPLNLGRHVSEVEELFGRQRPLFPEREGT